MCISISKKLRKFTLYSTLNEGSNAALIKILFDVTRNEADDEIEARESFMLVTSMLVVKGTGTSLKNKATNFRLTMKISFFIRNLKLGSTLV